MILIYFSSVQFNTIKLGLGLISVLWSLIPNWVDLISPNFTVNPPPHFHTLPTQLRFGVVARDRHQSEVVCYAKQVVRYRESKSPQVAPPPGLAGCLPAKAVSAHCEHTAAAARAHHPPALQWRQHVRHQIIPESSTPRQPTAAAAFAWRRKRLLYVLRWLTFRTTTASRRQFPGVLYGNHTLSDRCGPCAPLVGVWY